MPNQPEVIASFTQCPNPRHLADGLGNNILFEKIAEEEKNKGKIGEGMQFGMPAQGIITDIRKTVLTAPQVTIIWDVCMDCGIIFAKTVLRQEIELSSLSMRPGQQRPRGPFITK